ncbi:MAG: carbon monoxide dehydrogenase subunit G [Bryobacteraceae bacterium]|nr:carbon monoxide dehydrogenase subunit G [Bryobacteraceae bacterium]
MIIEGTRSVALEPQRLYTLLQDPDTLARCIPGCESLVKEGDQEYRLKMKLVIASVNGLFDGRVRIADPSPHESFRLIVEGSGRAGFVKGDGVIRLASDNGAGTNVHYKGEVHVGGTIAAVGQRLLDMTAKMVIKRFFDKVSEEAVAKASGT